MILRGKPLALSETRSPSFLPTHRLSFGQIAPSRMGAGGGGSEIIPKSLSSSRVLKF